MKALERSLILAAFVILVLSTSFVAEPEMPVASATTGVSGDVNGDGVADIADVIYCLEYMFASGPEPVCCRTAVDSGIGYPIAILDWLYSSGPDPGCW